MRWCCDDWSNDLCQTLEYIGNLEGWGSNQSTFGNPLDRLWAIGCTRNYESEESKYESGVIPGVVSVADCGDGISVRDL